MVRIPRDLRHVADARPVRAVLTHRSTVDADGAVVGTHETEDGLDERRLAGAVRPDHGRHASAPNLEVDAAQHVLRTVPLLEPRDVDHRTPPAIGRTDG